MLPQLERQFLQADLAQVQALLAQCSPDEDPIEYFQYGQRVQMLQGKLTAMPASIAVAPAGAAAVSRARVRIEGLSIVNREQQLGGQFIGWSDYSGQFDLVPHEGGNVVRGVITREVLERVEREGINPYKQHVKVSLKVREISVHNRSPKLAYTLTDFEVTGVPRDWPAQLVQTGDGVL
ncbi:MAG: hypothetical protein L0H12_06125 [Nitrosospira sp.]|nr:hypothetical protein [Nitrosospira sp.]